MSRVARYSQLFKISETTTTQKCKVFSFCSSKLHFSFPRLSHALHTQDLFMHIRIFYRNQKEEKEKKRTSRTIFLYLFLTDEVSKLDGITSRSSWNLTLLSNSNRQIVGYFPRNSYKESEWSSPDKGFSMFFKHIHTIFRLP